MFRGTYGITSLLSSTFLKKSEEDIVFGLYVIP